jgi:ribosome-associated protein
MRAGVHRPEEVVSCAIITGVQFDISLPEERVLESTEIARRAVEAAAEKQAADIVMLDVRAVCSFADYFVICSGETERQIQAIWDEVEAELEEDGMKLYRREGTVDSGWVLLDYSDVIVHIFSPEKRAYYQLEALWDKAVPVLRFQ